VAPGSPSWRRARRFASAGPLLILLLLVVSVVSACGDSGAGSLVDKAGGSGQNYLEGDGIVTRFDPTHRQAAPVIKGTSLDGEPIDVGSMAGDVVVLNLWASWCGPCRGEAPALESVYQETKDQGVRFVGLNTRDGTANAQAFQRAFKISYPSIDDQDQRLQLAFSSSVNPSTIPWTIILDRQQRIAAVIPGEATYTALKRTVESVAAEKE
jgi:thiol-disulfide isomerase/thioredoxin